MVTTMMIVCFLPSLGISIASFVIAGQNTNNTCVHSVVPLQTWLYVNAAVMAAFAAFVVLFVGLLLGSLLTLSDKKAAIIAGFLGCAFFVVLICYSCFLLAWNIIGSISLFRDNMTCFHNGVPVAAMVLACLIVQWISMFANWCSNRRGKKDDDDDNKCCVFSFNFSK